MQSLTFLIIVSNKLKTKTMIRIITLCFSLLYSMPSCVNKASAQLPITSAIPVLKVLVDSNMVALQIAKLDVSIKVTGNIATTIFDITYYNAADKVLEGEFDFPLADGQNICRYALDVNGVLREGVVVEKAKARVAYESTVRQKIDPGLVEKTKGNNLPPNIGPVPSINCVSAGILISGRNAIIATANKTMVPILRNVER